MAQLADQSPVRLAHQVIAHVQQRCNTRLLLQLAKPSNANHLVETVSINYEDFADAFLTCATCLATFDTEHKRAKLLSCSHSVCAACLERIVSLPQVRALPPTNTRAMPNYFCQQKRALVPVFSC